MIFPPLVSSIGQSNDTCTDYQNEWLGFTSRYWFGPSVEIQPRHVSLVCCSTCSWEIIVKLWHQFMQLVKHVRHAVKCSEVKTASDFYIYTLSITRQDMTEMENICIIYTGVLVVDTCWVGYMFYKHKLKKRTCINVFAIKWCFAPPRGSSSWLCTNKTRFRLWSVNF